MDPEFEDVLNMMDELRLRMDSTISDEQIARMKALDAKHRAHHWRGRNTRGPEPSLAETQEYQRSIPIRLRALAPAQDRAFLAELADDEERDRYFPIFEKAYIDIHTFQYAWIGMIMKDLQHKVPALYAIRSMLVYANILILIYCSQKALCVLRLCERAVDQLLTTMSEETGYDRFDLSIQEYKVAFFTSMALADLGRMEDSIQSFREAAFLEQLYRLQAMMEYKDRHMHDGEDLIQNLDNNISVLNELSQTLSISRRHLDESFDLDSPDDNDEDLALPVMDQLEDAQIWSCIQSLGFGSKDCNHEPVDCCPHCWTENTGERRKFCSRCKAVSYCNRECQRSDWKYHKEDCIPIQHAAQEMG